MADDDDDDYDYEKLFLRPLDAVARGQKWAILNQGFTVVFLILSVHKIGPFMPNSSVFIFFYVARPLWFN